MLVYSRYLCGECGGRSESTARSELLGCYSTGTPDSLHFSLIQNVCNATLQCRSDHCVGGGGLCTGMIGPVNGASGGDKA